MTQLDHYRFASGRRRYNRQRQLQVECRRLRLWGTPDTMLALTLRRRGSQAAMARALGVSRWTIYRDVQAWWQWIRQSREPIG